MSKVEPQRLRWVCSAASGPLECVSKLLGFVSVEPLEVLIEEPALVELGMSDIVPELDAPVWLLLPV